MGSIGECESPTQNPIFPGEQWYVNTQGISGSLPLKKYGKTKTIKEKFNRIHKYKFFKINKDLTRKTPQRNNFIIKFGSDSMYVTFPFLSLNVRMEY